MADSKNKVVIHFEAKDKNLINQLKKLNNISKQLTNTQTKLKLNDNQICAKQILSESSIRDN